MHQMTQYDTVQNIYLIMCKLRNRPGLAYAELFHVWVCIDT